MKNLLLNKFIKILFLMFGFVHMLAAQTEYPFKHITIDNGLSNNQINCIFRDSKGFLWFGTSSGLNRFDGNNFKIFFHEAQNPASLIDNSVLSIQEDIEKNLWLNTGAGYSIYETEKERFIYPIGKYLSKFGYNDTVTFLYIDPLKNIWLANNSGDCFFKKPNDSSWKIIDSLPKEQITGITQDETLYYLIFSNGQILFLNKKDLKVVKSIFVVNAFDLPNINSFRIFVDKGHDIWLYQETDPIGIFYYASKKDDWEHLTSAYNSKYLLTSNTIEDITQDNQNQVWIATDHGGINIIDKNTESVTYIKHDPTDPRSIAEKSIMCLYYDKDNTMWIGSYKYGISYYNESIFKFNHIKPAFFNAKFDNDLNCFQEDLDGNFWIGSNNKGLLRMDNTAKKTDIFQNNPNDPNSLSSNVVVTLLCDHRGNMWIGTYQGGLNCFNGSRFIHYQNEPNNSHSIANNNIWDLIEDSEGNLWIATLGSGVDKMNLKTGGITHYSTSTGAQLSSDYVLCVQETRDKNILLGTAHGLTIYEPKTNSFHIIEGNFSGTKQFVNRNILSIYEDSRGLIWVGTREGLNVINPKTDDLILLNKETGIADNVVCGILEDDNKNIWISTANGLSHIIISTNPKTGEYDFIANNYDEKDGLQGKAFNERSAYKASSGDIIFGGTNGYNIVNPATLKYNRVRPKLILTDFLLFNKSVAVDSLYHKRIILKKDISECSEIDLQHDENIFTIDFSALNFLQPDKTIYKYKLEGFDSHWVTIRGKNASATYTNLDPETYEFMVTAANNDGFWAEEPLKFTIVVHPPLWRTTFAYIVYYLLIAALILSITLFVRRRMRMRFEIAQERLETKRNHELDQMKLRFFTNISHEFRTQIALIITPLEKLIKKNENSEDIKALKLINRNANKLLLLVNQILDFRKMDVQGHKLNLSNGDIVQVIRESCHSFAETYDKKNIRMTFSTIIEEIRMNFDEDKITKIVNNLLSNAYKFTPEGGKIEVKLSFTIQNNQQMLKVSIADTGIGVADEARNLIFDRFYQVDVPETKATGSGIGLHISKEFVILHGGNIWMESNIPKGSMFIFTIPIINSDITEVETHEVVETLSISNEDDNEVEYDNICRKKTILLVDDNEDFRTFLSDSLKDQFEVLEAENGEKAFDIVIQHIPDLIISDIMMPVVDGYELCQMIKSDLRSSHIPVILLTARTANEHIVQGLELGADDYITKPFNSDILLLRINKLLEQRTEVHNQILQKKEINPSEIKVSSLDEQLIDKAIKCVEENIDNADFSVEMLSQEMGMSRVHLYKKLLSITGKTPIEFIRILRLKRAAQLLGKSQLTVSEVAYLVGFNNPKYFSRYFKEEFGMLPSVYAEKNK